MHGVLMTRDRSEATHMQRTACQGVSFARRVFEHEQCNIGVAITAGHRNYLLWQ